ncbi:hypothetical protein GTPT_1315 [Tatumella ptyseos ATCC 33301]|uniref:Uncharacterized protein n=1 Tax=Tatumella ptyseos ATCC 33301 TaxID=1005995 RepID=A0A085JJ73_9GAMM|nr:hypothetical protein GTPT_1315 [Tatumella ptyseos ATCC 33301]
MTERHLMKKMKTVISSPSRRYLLISADKGLDSAATPDKREVCLIYKWQEI